MSESYKFKAMSEVETLEAPTEATTLLAVEGGAVRQIPAGNIGGGGGGYVVWGDFDMNTISMTADKTYGEILAAVENGCTPVLNLSASGYMYLLPLIVVEGNVLFFAMTNGTMTLQVSCTSENVWDVIMPGD